MNINRAMIASTMKMVYSMGGPYPRRSSSKRSDSCARPVDSSGSCSSVRSVSAHIDIDLPLHSRYATTVRAVAASVAADAGFSVDDIEDLRLGVNEAVAVVSDVDASESARLLVRFDVERGSVTVRASRTGVDEPLDAGAIDVLAARILDAVADEHRIEDGAFVVVKRLANDAAA